MLNFTLCLCYQILEKINALYYINDMPQSKKIKVSKIK